MMPPWLSGSGNKPPRRTDAFDYSSRSLRCIKIKTIPKDGLFYGAGDEARTRYLHLGKVALYRMSYTREEHSLL